MKIAICDDDEMMQKEVKRFIGYVKDGETPSWKIDEESYSPEVVSSYVLKKLKKEAEKYLQHEVDDVVITVPANFNFNQVGATRTAAKLAGFKEVHTLAEPTAAIIDYLNEERQKAPESRRIDITKGKLTLLVADIGGGTSDISIMEVSEDASGTINIQELSLSQYQIEDQILTIQLNGKLIMSNSDKTKNEKIGRAHV